MDIRNDDICNMDIVIEFDSVSYGYTQNRKLLNNASFHVSRGEIVGIVGPSGEGKTTLLRLLNGSLIKKGKNFNGQIKIKNSDIRECKDINRVIGCIYQNPDDQIIFTNVTDEIVFGMENYNYSMSEMEAKLKHIMKVLHIEHLQDRNPNNLSGGEKQLVVLASILCLDVEIILLDEAFTGVDNEGEKRILDILFDLKNRGMTIIMIEHDYSHLVYADRIYNLEDGRINLLNSLKGLGR